MSLRHALDDYKHNRAGDRVFPGELRTATGRFSGVGDRLVHVAPDGSLRDYSYPLSGLSGIERSRFGVAFHDETAQTDDGGGRERPEIHWFDATDSTQRYVGDTVIETTHEVAGETVVQQDHTDGRVHRTRFETDRTATLYGYVEFAPDRAEGQLAILRHADTVEAYHREEHDFLAVDGTDVTITGEIPATLSELLDTTPTTFPRERPAGRYEDRSLTAGVVVSATFSDGVVSTATLPTESTATPRTDALGRVRSAADDARRGISTDEPSTATDQSGLDRILTQDLRVLRLLSTPGGGRIAGPDFDPMYTSSGGYGYTWFRDDAEIARFLLATDARIDDSLGDWHEDAATFYAETQLADGSWPHRVWPDDGTLAPGWANARLESGDDGDYQADQTASVTTFLADALRRGAVTDDESVRDTLVGALDALDDSLADDGLPVACQNAWENMQGRFSHTAFTFLHAYAALGRLDDDRLRARTPEFDRRVRDGIESLLAGLDELWLPAESRYALRLTDGAIDDRADAASLAAVGAMQALDETDVGLSERHLDRLVAHVDHTVSVLFRETDAVRGLVRFEGDQWRRAGQDESKVWTVSTAWGAHASASLATLLRERGDDRADAHDTQARTLLGELLPGGSLLDDGGYLPEQVFDDGTVDCARPLGWPHALRSATATELAERGELHGAGGLVESTESLGTPDD